MIGCHGVLFNKLNQLNCFDEVKLMSKRAGVKPIYTHGKCRKRRNDRLPAPVLPKGVKKVFKPANPRAKRDKSCCLLRVKLLLNWNAGSISGSFVSLVHETFNQTDPCRRTARPFNRGDHDTDLSDLYLCSICAGRA